MSYNINEIFYSIQGEGTFTGVPSLFVRFAGCNKQCSFCDTPDEINQVLEENALIDLMTEQIDLFEVENIVLTGGEPLLQSIEPIVVFLADEGLTCHIETNGSINVSREVADLCYLTVSPKDKDFVQREGHQLKLIYTGEPVDFNYYYDNTSFEYYILQPEWSGGLELAKKAIDMVMKERYGYWRFGAQVHKLIGVK